MYDEYFSNRKSYEITDSVCGERTKKYNEITLEAVTGFLTTLTHSENHYDHVKNEIARFRNHANAQRFMESTTLTFDTITKSFVYLLSYTHHFGEYEKILESMPETYFIDQFAFETGELFKNKFEQNNFDLVDCVAIFKQFMKKFGLQFEDNEGLYLTVLDI
ncbi:MAG: hypothetical protein QTN59_16825 [Candidatus Electrothrix communis]|nr:MAG: hypothetical protein QTN59_16825 [Candidatus Electrothrix communis]